MRVLLVEDDAKLGPLLVRVLRAEGHDIQLATTCAAGLEAARGQRPDAIILDWMLPDGDGLDLCETLGRLGIDAPILMLTARSELADRVQGLDRGADDYLVKPFEIDELVARLRALVRRTTRSNSIVAGALTLDRLERRAFAHGSLLELTAREYELLSYLATNADRPVSRRDLLADVWESDDLGGNVLDVHMSRLRDKLGAHSWMLETVRSVGYRLRTAR